MEWTWIILNNIIFGYDKTIINKMNVESIYMFDLDNTLIKTKSGKKFPINNSDWKFLYPEIPNKLSQYFQSIIGIISNQKGLKNKNQINDWMIKIKNIINGLNVHFVFASILDDRFRKPLPNSWNYIQEQILYNIDINSLKTKNKIYYIGDAFGRPNDFSDTDIKYAINCEFKFKTPELFFKNSRNDLSGSITYPILNYYTKKAQSNLFDSINLLIESNNSVLIMLIGFPASGNFFIQIMMISHPMKIQIN